MPFTGPQSVTVPGAVAGWQALLERHGTWSLGRCLADAIDAAANGFDGDAGDRRRLEPHRARAGRLRRGRARVPAGARGRHDVAQPRPGGDAEAHRRRGARRLLPRPGGGGDRVGDVARGVRPRGHARPTGSSRCASASATPRCASCRRTGRAPRRCRRWASPRDLDLGSLADADRVHVQAEAMKLAFADAYRYIADEPLPAGYLEESYLASRRAQIDLARAGDPGPGDLPRGGTVYLTVVDRDRMACSFIQSIYIGFGSRVVAPGTGVMLQNRGGCFTLEAGPPEPPGALQAAVPHDHPGDAARRRRRGAGRPVRPDGRPRAAAGPPAAAHEPPLPRPRPAGRARRAALAPRPGRRRLAAVPRAGPLARRRRPRAAAATASGAIPSRPSYGGGQAIMLRGDELVGGSEPRKDGLAAGY